MRRALMSLCRLFLPDAGLRRYANALCVVVATNLLTALVFYQHGGGERTTRNWVGPQPYSSSRNCTQLYNLNRPDYSFLYRASSSPPSPSLPAVFVITPTHTCTTQKVDLTSLCQTLSLVPKLTWIVVEDSRTKTKLVSHLLSKCMVESVHLSVATSTKYKSSLPWPLYRMFGTVRGVEQRNAGLRWLRENYHPKNSSGVVYFIDDDNKIDVRLFSEIRKTKEVSVFNVGFAGGVYYEGPVCGEDGRVREWHSPSAEWRYGMDKAVPDLYAVFKINIVCNLAQLKRGT
ncbi:Galactosylgalactosylxylosylprotein 3-beta-glucuronosyltransferase 2 [Geodia barretti]|uniref:Galactosylgalactosylxylosylprotein 3-beta-glucuronosyltransferase n=1 Tax=Geodia barretti TaxID=519541 RepID=A0AA35SRB2_GEOBA|nr:Galactosylgalactosylxylosylprotein 3-beta-glucuronosyltransferase 2 [Geodia barretti]